MASHRRMNYIFLILIVHMFLFSCQLEQSCLVVEGWTFYSQRLNHSRYPSIHLSVYPSIHLSIYLSIHLSIYLCQEYTMKLLHRIFAKFSNFREHFRFVFREKRPRNSALSRKCSCEKCLNSFFFWKKSRRIVLFKCDFRKRILFKRIIVINVIKWNW